MGTAFSREPTLELEVEHLSPQVETSVNFGSPLKLSRLPMAELEAQCSQETDKMLGGSQGDDDDLTALEFSLPVQLSHSIVNY